MLWKSSFFILSSRRTNSDNKLIDVDSWCVKYPKVPNWILYSNSSSIQVMAHHVYVSNLFNINKKNIFLLSQGEGWFKRETFRLKHVHQSCLWVPHMFLFTNCGSPWRPFMGRNQMLTPTAAYYRMSVPSP